MKALDWRLRGMKKKVAVTINILFDSIKFDLLGIVQQISKVLQEADLLLPSLFSICSRGLKNIKKVRKLLDELSYNIFFRDDLFPTAAEMIEKLGGNDDDRDDEKDIVTPVQQTRQDETPDGYCMLNGYLISGTIQKALVECRNEFAMILAELERGLTQRLESIVENPLYESISVFLDSRNYQYQSIDDVYSHVKNISERFKAILIPNGCELHILKVDFDIMFDYISKFLKNVKPNDCWSAIFHQRDALSVINLLHVIEISLVTPLANAESERVFSFLWRNFSKERSSLKNKTLENILIMRGATDYSDERYCVGLQITQMKDIAM